MVLANFVEKRMTDKCCTTALFSKPGFFEWQRTQNVIDEPAHLFDSPACPGPNLWWAVIQNRNPVRFCASSNPPVKSGVVDQDNGVGPMMPEVTIGSTRQCKE